MTNEQLEILLSLYKKAVEKKLTSGDFVQQFHEANIKLDASFVETGNEDKNLGEFLRELKELQKITENE